MLLSITELPDEMAEIITQQILKIPKKKKKNWFGNKSNKTV